VSNTSFTPGAPKVALQRGIILMHYTEFAAFDPALEE
jgi:hypothetical protein